MPQHSKNSIIRPNKAATKFNMKFQTQYNAQEFPRIRERSNKPSMTIPDQSMTVSELVERNKRGLPLGGAKVAIWDENPETDFLPDIKKMDLAEIQEMKDNVQAIIKEKQADLEKIEKKKQGNKMKQLEDEITKLKQSQQQQPAPTPVES